MLGKNLFLKKGGKSFRTDFWNPVNGFPIFITRYDPGKDTGVCPT